MGNLLNGRLLENGETEALGDVAVFLSLHDFDDEFDDNLSDK